MVEERVAATEPAPGGRALLTTARATAALVVAVSGLGLAFAAGRQALTADGPWGLDRLFHLGLGVTLAALFCAFVLAILRARRILSALLIGVAGFVGCLASAVAGELFGPPALGVLTALVVVWLTVAVFGPAPGDVLGRSR